MLIVKQQINWPGKAVELIVINNPSLSPNPAIAVLSQHAPPEQQVALYHAASLQAERAGNAHHQSDEEADIEGENGEEYEVAVDVMEMLEEEDELQSFL